MASLWVSRHDCAAAQIVANADSQHHNNITVYHKNPLLSTLPSVVIPAAELILFSGRVPSRDPLKGYTGLTRP